jgi:hypothetical protein
MPGGKCKDMEEGGMTQKGIFRIFAIVDLPDNDQIRKPGPTNGSHLGGGAVSGKFWEWRWGD